MALGKMKAKDAVKPLLSMAGAPSAVIRREVARALGRIGDRSALPALTNMLDDREPEPRQVSVWALGEIGDSRAGPKLVALLQDPSESIRLAAATSLCRLGNAEGRAFAEGLLKSKEAFERRDAAQMLEEVRAGWVKQALVALLHDPDFSVRLASAHTLAKQGDGRGVEWMVLAAEAADAEETLRIVTALEDLGVSSADRKKILEAHKKKP